MTAINNLPGLAKFNNATHETDGLMSRNDKEKLDSLHKSVTIHATLYASEWSENRPYTQTIDILDLTSDTNGSLTIDPLATDDELNACIEAEIIIAEQSINYMTLQATGKKPEIDIPVIIVFGENLAIITPPTIVDSGNHVHNLIIQPTDWISYLDTYKATLYVAGINDSVVGSISMKTGIEESEAEMAAKARIEVFTVKDNTVELILRGEKPNIPLHVTIYYGPSISIVRKPVFGGKLTPHAMYQEFDDSKTGLGVTKTQSAIEKIVTGTNGMNNKPTHFKTVAVMKECMELLVGQLVETSGYRTENDGGGATYIITSNADKEDNGGSVHVLKNGLRAEIVLELGQDINLKCFGLYGDAIHDDVPAFKRGFDFCKQIKGGTVRWQGVAALNEPLVVDSHYINIQGYGYGSTLKANFERDYVISVSYEEHSTTEEIQQILIGNFRIDGNRKAKHGLIVDDNLPVYDSIFENIHITGTTDYGLIADCCKNCQFNLITVETCYGGIELIGSVNNCKFDNCKVEDSPVNEPLKVTYHKLDGQDTPLEERPTRVEFNSCFFGDSESQNLIVIDRSMDVDFNRCSFDLKHTLCEDYSIIVNEHSLYTRFNDCFMNGRNKTCGIIKNNGPDTTVRNFKALDIKSNIHILTVDDIHVSDMVLVGDSTPLVIYTPNDDKTILDIDSIVKNVKDDTTVFPSNANYYNFYMNQQDKLGVKGRLNNYIIESHLEDEEFDKIFTANNTDRFNNNFKLPSEGVWELDMFLNIDDGNQGKICKYQMIFKQNSVYSVANIQKLTDSIEWGNNIVLNDPVIDKFGNVTLSFNDTTETNRTTWTLKLKARKILSYKI